MRAPVRNLPRRDALRGLLALGFAGCNAADRPTTKPVTQTPDGPDPEPPPVHPPTEPDATSPTDAAAIARAIDDFAIDLHRAVAPADRNMIASPASISLAFAMLHAGARGTTAAELARAFHWEGDAAALHAGFAEAQAGWAKPAEDVEMHVANRLFGDAKVKFEQAYLELGARVFGAALEPVDFRGHPDDERKRINAWVEQQTHERITELIPGGALDATARLVLVNAIYFKAGWSDPFQESQTERGDFFAPAGKRSAKMMHQVGHFATATHEGARLIEMPYGYGRYTMTVVLPEARNGLAAIEAKLSRAWLDEGLAALRGERVALAFPRFKIEAPEPLRLRSVLQKLGVSQVFTTGADLTGIAPKAEQLMVSEAFHKAFIAVDEKGTEAAAATAIGVKAGAAPVQSDPVKVVVDHPFAFALRDTTTGAILFLGHVVDPTA